MTRNGFSYDCFLAVLILKFLDCMSLSVLIIVIDVVSLIAVKNKAGRVLLAVAVEDGHNTGTFLTQTE